MLASPEASEAPGSGMGMRRSSTANSLSVQQTQLDRPRRSKSSNGRDHKAIEAALADAAPKPSTKGSPPKAFRVLPGRFSVHGPEAPPTPRRQTPRAPKRTPRLSPRCTLSASHVGGRLQVDQDDRRRRRATAITSAEVSPSYHDANLRRSASSFLMGEGAGLPAGYPTVTPPSSSSREVLSAPNGTTNLIDTADLAGGHQSALTMSGTTTPTDCGGEQQLGVLFARARAQAPDSRIMRLIGKRSVLRTSNGAPGPEVAQQRHHRARQRCMLPAAAASGGGLASGSTSSSSVAAPCAASPEAAATSAKMEAVLSQPATWSSRALRCSGAQSSSASEIPVLGSSGTESFFGGGHSFDAGEEVEREEASLAARAFAVVAEVTAQVDRAKAESSGPKNQTTSHRESGEQDEADLQQAGQAEADLESAGQVEVELEAAPADQQASTSAAQDNHHSLQQQQPADGAEGAIIWPGASVALKSETEAARFAPTSAAGPEERAAQYREQSDAAKGAAVQEEIDPSAGGKDPAFTGVVPYISGPLLLNEVGSLVVPQTWRYVPAPAEQLQLGQAASEAVGGSAPQAARPTTSEPSAPEVVEDQKETDDDQDNCPILELGEKQRLVEDLVVYLMGKATRCEKELEGEQRANRALRMSLEVEQRRSATLQQQLAWLAHQAGYQLPEDGLLAASSQ